MLIRHPLVKVISRLIPILKSGNFHLQNKRIDFLKTTFLSIFLLLLNQSNAQLASVLEADYLIVGTSEVGEAIYSDRGKIMLDTNKSLLQFNSRDEEKRLDINTSGMSIDFMNGNEVDLKSFQNFNEVQIFKYILDPSLIDFGLRDLGLESKFINKDEDGIFMDWKATNKYQAIFSKVLTKVKGEKFDRVEYFDVQGNLLCEIIFEEWGEEELQNTPLKIKTRYHIDGKSYDRMIKLSQVKMLTS